MYRTVFTKVYVSMLVLLFGSFIFHMLFRKTIFMMAPVCSRNYRNSDSTCTHQKRCDALGPKVQHSTNNKFYSLFTGRVQPGPHIAQIWDEKLAGAPRVFLFIVL